MQTSEFSFVHFASEIEDCNCEFVLPVASLSDLVFQSDSAGVVYITTLNGDRLALVSLLIQSANYWFASPTDLSIYLACGDCFRLMVDDLSGGIWYSNPFRYDKDTDNTVLFHYWCDEPQFGIDYDGTRYSSIRLPATLSSGNFNKDESIYEDGNGKRIILYRELREKNNFQTDYLPEEIHKKISVMFAHSYLRVDGIEMDEDGTYTVDWDSSIKRKCLKLAKGTTTLVYNSVIRNTNC